METLEDNIFFKKLTTKYKKRFQEVIQNCYHLCLPVNGSYDPKQINDEFITSHILKASPLLKSHFLPLNNKQNFHVQIDKNYMRVTKGFSDQNRTLIRILFEETAYNENKKYSIFICELPLICSLNAKLKYESLDSSSQDLKLVSFEDCENFLRHISSTELEKLKNKINELIRTYIILPNYLNDVAQRLKKIIDQFIISFMSYYSKNAKYRNNKELLCSMIESFSVGLIHDKLITLIKKKVSKEDEIFMKKTKDIKRSNLKLTNFGTQKEFENFSISRDLVDTLKELDQHITPLAKLNCMRRTLDLINDQLKRTVDEQKSPFDKLNETICITPDDLLGALICVLAQCELDSFCSNIEFIHSFSWYLPQNSELGYSLTTFKVAKEYILNYTDSNQSDNNTNKPKQNSIYSPSRSDSNYSQLSNFDYEIDKITKMLENSELNNDTQYRSPQPPPPSQSNEDDLMGGFLRSLTGSYLTKSIQKY